MDLFVAGLIREIELTKTYLSTNEITTLYFGGGTPSILPTGWLSIIIAKIKENYSFKNEIEITLEANPDDIDQNFITEIVKSGINRLSLGVQSFHDKELKLFNRTHNSDIALNSIKICRENGIENINIDLIFGVPGSDISSWKKNLDIFLDLKIDHLSCYNLTIENRTAISHMIKTGKLHDVNDEIASEQFLETIDQLGNMGFDHYEISNYAKNGNYAVHNTNYWKGEHYLGLGPSAHSFNGNTRHWNISNIRKYIQSIDQGLLPVESEILTIKEKYNEYIMTGLRTMWGIELKQIMQFNDYFASMFQEKVNFYIQNGMIIEKNGNYILSKNGKLFADRIASDLFC